MILPGSAGILDKVVLEAGAGGITICEVQIRKGPAYEIMVDPQPDSEVYRAAEELCEGLWARRSGSTEDEDNSKGVSREVDRALRNMAGLPRQRKDQEGKRVTVDHALELANKCESLSELQSFLLGESPPVGTKDTQNLLLAGQWSLAIVLDAEDFHRDKQRSQAGYRTTATDRCRDSR